MQSLGPYRLLHRIGAGGMGVVHLALDARGRAVAVKAVHPHIVGDQQGRARLAREVAAMRRVVGARVAEVLDADVNADPPYIVTRYVSGLPLDRLVEIDGPMRGADLWRLARGLAEALDTMHSAGVVHRDLKPGNVLIADGSPVVIDFGLAQVTDEARITRTGTLFGTPGYLAPELLDSVRVTAASDVHSWAATVAYAATGRPPYGSGPMEAVLERIRHGEADLAGVPWPLHDLVRAGLAVEPAQRPSPRALLTAMAAEAQSPVAARSAPTAATRVLTAAGPVAVPPSPWARGSTPVVAPLPPPPIAAPVGVAPGSPEPVATWPEVAPLQATSPPEALRSRGVALVVLATLAVFVAAATVAPVAAAIMYGVGMAVMRTVEHSATMLRRRRSLRGVRPSDFLVGTAALPWHATRATLGALVQVMFGAAAAAVVLGAAWAGDAATGLDEPGARAVLVAAAGVAAVVSWWGPGAGTARRGAARTVHGVLPGRWVRVAVAAALVAVAVLLVTSSIVATSWPLG